MPFFSEMAGAAVVDAQGKAQGKVADMVVSADAQYPMITALLVRGRGESTLIPWDEVERYDATVVLRHDGAQLAPYRSKGHELFLGEQILDRQIVDVEGRKVVRVNDLQLARTNDHYTLVGVDISAQALLRRLGIQRFTRRLGIKPRENFIAWRDVDPLASDTSGLRLRVAHDNLARLHPADLAEIVDQLSVQDGVALFEGMDDELAAEALEEVTPERQVSLLEGMESEKAADILEEMDPSTAADVLGEMSDEKATELLALMEHEESEDVKELLSYREDSAGGIMTTDYVAVPETWTAAEVISHLRTVAEEIDIVYYVWVVTDLASETLVGMTTLRDLILAQPDMPVSRFMKSEPLTLGLDEDQEQAAKMIAKYNMMAAPVVDKEGHLRGIVTVDDAIDIILPTAWKKRLPRLFA